MKRILTLLIFIFSILTFEASSQKIKYEKSSFEVYGNCDMCKTLIETTARSIDGVKMAKWNSTKKTMKVKFNKDLTSIDEIQKAISNIGYDTAKHRAPDEVYEKLHYCCKYDRKPKK